MSRASLQLERLLQVMEALRDPVRGCPWDLAQTPRSIVPHTLEEAYELATAIETGSVDAVREELGDLLFQVVFQAQLAREQGAFDFADVAAAIHDKLRLRHPHVFATPGSELGDLGAAWDAHKAVERHTQGLTGVLDGVALALPALCRASKLGRRAAAVGFDWPDVDGVRAKVQEELAELDAAALAGDARALREELGDLLFSVANLARRHGVDGEEALRLANGKFEQRFQAMERLAKQRGLELEKLSLEQWDALWNEVKQSALADGHCGGLSPG